MIGWKYETAGDQQIKKLRIWKKKQHNELVEDIQIVLDYVISLEESKLKSFLRTVKERISIRRSYIETNFGARGSMACYGGEIQPKPSLITGEEKGQ